MGSRPTRAANRLAGETSPYLLQHAYNPVDWYPWGEEALTRAKAEQKPIFLSVGYSACHWCHVMERESFEDEGIAGQLAADFVAIKVDREERPDVDEIYMKAVQAMTGAGGWPMSVFLTPDLEPFWGGTYFPPRSRYGRPGFVDVLSSIAQAWKSNRARLIEHGAQMARRIADEGRANLFAELDPDLLDRSFVSLAQSFDAEWGGFGNAPKFPHAMDIRLVLRHWLRTGDPKALHIAVVTLERMAAGGIHDQLGGGFHRYSTDEKWLIPHFEKMLYDNALLVPAYLEAHLATGDAAFADVARGACEWMLREMRTAEGGFASAQDADSEGVEGKYFAWTPQELGAVLGEARGARAALWFGVTAEGNFEHGSSALWRPDSAAEVARRLGIEAATLAAEMEQARRTLLAARAKRVPPATDDKVLASWNGLAISALAQAFQVLDELRFLDAARDAANYVLQHMRTADGRLFATARAGRAHLNAYLDDYAFMIQGLLDLFESDFDPRWLAEARSLATSVAEHFEDDVNGGYFTTSEDHETLIARLKSPHDGALPSGNAVQALNLLRLAEFTGDVAWARAAETTIRALGALANRYPQAFSQLLLAVDFLAAQPREIVLAGRAEDPRTKAMLAAVRRSFRPQRVVVLAHEAIDPALVPLVRDKRPAGDDPLAYVCRNYACERPMASADALAAALR